MKKEEMIDEIIKNQERVEERYFSRERLERMDSDLLSDICEASRHLIHK